MRAKLSFTTGCFSLALLLSSGGLRPAHADPFADLLPTAAEVTHRAVTNGNWGAGTTWSTGTAPGNNAVVEIPTNITVNIGNPYTNSKLAKLAIYGTLNFTSGGKGELNLDSLLIPASGTLKMGTEAAPLGATNLARITIFSTNIDTTADPFLLGHGLVAKGKLLMNGAAKTAFAPLTGDAMAGTTNLTLAQVPSGWLVGDEVAVAATTFTTNWSSTNAMIENEVRTIYAISGSNVTLKSALSTNHVRAETNLPIHVANLTRNAVIQSESVADISQRGHVMLMTNGCTIRNALFLRMGRTDKRAYVTDPQTNSSGVLIPGTCDNPRGRYGLHFHLAGVDIQQQTPAVVTGCVVRDTPGWGFVNHASYVNFTNNVAFDFDGAGFTTENGDEAGSFVNNLALGGTGNGRFPQTRTIFGDQPRTDLGDMGFTGEGFWFQGPDVTVINNIAAGCKGCGYMFWCAGRYDPGLKHYTGFLTNRLSGTSPGDPICSVTPRTWNYTTNRALIADFPVRQFSNNVAYACFTGLKFRFVNQSAVPVYSSTTPSNTFNTEVVGAATRVRYTISDSTFWNNLNGIHSTYNTMVDFRNVQIVCANTNGGNGGIGFDVHTQAQNCTLTNITIKNYLTGFWQSDTVFQATNNITMTGVVEAYYTKTNGNPYGFTAKHQKFNDLPSTPP